jgi:hypothetical protein
MIVSRRFVLAVLLLLAGVRASGWAKEDTFLFYQDHRVAVAVPDDYTYTRGVDESGLPIARITDPKQEIILEITFLPDPENQFATPAAQRAFMAENFNKYVRGSVEKAMQFDELKPRVGRASFCVFTDATLVGKTELPPNEFLNATTGIKQWPGCAAFFTLLSHGTTSPAYVAAMKILTESVQDKKGPPAF